MPCLFAGLPTTTERLEGGGSLIQFENASISESTLGNKIRLENTEGQIDRLLPVITSSHRSIDATSQ